MPLSVHDVGKGTGLIPAEKPGQSPCKMLQFNNTSVTMQPRRLPAERLPYQAMAGNSREDTRDLHAYKVQGRMSKCNRTAYKALQGPKQAPVEVELRADKVDNCI